MGVKYSASESAALIQVMTNNVATANQVIDRLSSGCDHLIGALDSGELQGAAYTAGRGLFSDIIIPSIQKLQQAIDDIQMELASYQAADSVISGFGTLDRDQLEQLKKLREKQLRVVQDQIKENEDFFKQLGSLFSGNLVTLWRQTKSLENAEYQISQGITDIQDKLDKLDWFVAEVSQYFTDSLQVLQLAIQGATQLSQVIVDSGGNYYTDGLDMTWVTKMKDEVISTHTLAKNTPITRAEKDKKAIVDDFVSTYQLDNETAEILYKLQQGILKEAERKSWSKEKVIYEYNRIVASFASDSYVADRWKAICGTVDEVERGELVSEYGLSSKDITKLQTEIKSQHTNSATAKDLAHEAVQIAAFTEQSWNDRDLSTKQGWKEYVYHFASQWGNQMPAGDIILPTESYEISFKGDIDSKKYDDTDFNSDLDAINVYSRMSDDKVKASELFTLQANYNAAINTNRTNRTEEFYRVMGQGNVETGKKNIQYIAEQNTIGGNFIKHGFSLEFFTSELTDSDKKAITDFYQYLEKGEKDNVK